MGKLKGQDLIQFSKDDIMNYNLSKFLDKIKITT